MRMTQELLDHLHALRRAILEAGHWTETDHENDNSLNWRVGDEYNKDDYLLRYDLVANGETQETDLVVMGDLGVTYEPPRVWTTPKLAEITGTDLEADLKTLIETAPNNQRNGVEVS